MEHEWLPVYVSDKMHLIEIVKAILKTNHIAFVEVDKKDSTNIMMGAVEIHVQRKELLRAKFLIEKNEL